MKREDINKLPSYYQVCDGPSLRKSTDTANRDLRSYKSEKHFLNENETSSGDENSVREAYLGKGNHSKRSRNNMGYKSSLLLRQVPVARSVGNKASLSYKPKVYECPKMNSILANFTPKSFCRSS